MLHDSSVQLRALAQLVSRTISRAPGGSFTSAQDFCDALAEIPTHRARSRIVVAAALSAFVAATAAVWVAQNGSQPPVIDDGYAVLPFAGGTPQASGQKIAEQLSDAIAEWDGARLADAAVVSSILAKRGAEPLDLDAATAAARSARVRRAIWGTATPARDSIVLRLGVYEAASGRATRSVVRTIPQPRDTGFAQSMRDVANALLRDGSVTGLRVPSDGRHHSLASWRALDSGLKQLSASNNGRRGAASHSRAARAAECARQFVAFANAHLVERSEQHRRQADVRAAGDRRRGASVGARFDSRIRVARDDLRRSSRRMRAVFVASAL